MTSTTFVVPCLLSSFKHLIAVKYNSSIKNTTDIVGAPLRRRLPQFCFASQTRSIQTQTDFFTNVTIERSIHIFLKLLIIF